MNRFSYKKLESLLNENPFDIKCVYKGRHSMPMGVITEKNNMVWFELNGEEKSLCYTTSFGYYGFGSSFHFDYYGTGGGTEKDEYYWFEKVIKKYINGLGKQ